MITDDMLLLRKAIIANPSDDTIRLGYADLCDEVGGQVNEDYARFIRLQIELQHPPQEDNFTALAQWTEKLRESQGLLNGSHLTEHDLELIVSKLMSNERFSEKEPFYISSTATYERGFVNSIRLYGNSELFSTDGFNTGVWLEHFPIEYIYPMLRMANINRSPLYTTVYDFRGAVDIAMFELIWNEISVDFKHTMHSQRVLQHADKVELRNAIGSALCRAMHKIMNGQLDMPALV